MTVIAVCTDGTRCCMGSDSQVSNNGAVLVGGSKIAKSGPYLVGVAGSSAMADLLRCDTVPLGPTPAVEEWAYRALVPWLRFEMGERDLLVKAGDRTEWPGQILIAWKGEWLLIDSAGGIVRPAGAWWAIGSGGVEARGAMHAVAKMVPAFEHGTEVIVRSGLEAACDLDDCCCRPVHVEWT